MSDAMTRQTALSTLTAGRELKHQMMLTKGQSTPNVIALYRKVESQRTSGSSPSESACPGNFVSAANKPISTDAATVIKTRMHPFMLGVMQIVA